MEWIIALIVWAFGAVFLLILFYGASPRRSYCVEDEKEDDQEQLDYLNKLGDRK